MSETSRRVLANHVQNGIAVGGRLTIDAEKLSFAPNTVNKLLGDALAAVGIGHRPESAEIRLCDVASVGKTKRSLAGLYAGSTRERLLIKLKDGTEEIFVVNKLKDLIAHISGLLPE